MDEVPEKEKKAEFDGEDGCPAQAKVDVRDLLIPNQLVLEFWRQLRRGTTGNIIFNHEDHRAIDEEQAHGGAEAHDGEEQKSIVDEEALAITQPDRDPRDGGEDGDAEERYGRGLLCIS